MPRKRKTAWVSGGRFTRDYVLKVERAIGKRLPHGAVVHHHNDDQLVVCPDQAYHMLLHARQRALEEAGDPNLRKCIFCAKYDKQDALIYYHSARSWRHMECSRRNDRERYWSKKNASRDTGT